MDVSDQVSSSCWVLTDIECNASKRHARPEVTEDACAVVGILQGEVERFEKLESMFVVYSVTAVWRLADVVDIEQT